MNPESIPHKEHIPGAVKFKEAEDTKELSKTATVISIIVMVIMGIFATMRMGRFILMDPCKCGWESCFHSRFYFHMKFCMLYASKKMYICIQTGNRGCCLWLVRRP